MKTIKFDKIKKNAEFAFLVASGQGPFTGAGNGIFLALYAAIHHNQPPREILEDWIKYGKNLIKNWDVRSVKKLIELFPGCVPKYLANKSIFVEYNENGKWVVCFK